MRGGPLRPYSQERPWLDEVVLNGIARRDTARGDVELRIDRTHMRIDRRKANHQLFGNLGAGQSHRQQAYDLALSPGQSVMSGCSRFSCMSVKLTCSHR